MLMKQAFLLLCLVAASLSAESIDKRDDHVTYLNSGSFIDLKSKSRVLGFFERELEIYCYRGSPKTLGRLFESVELLFEFEDDDYTQYEGSTPSEVRSHQEERRSLFSISLFSQKRERLHLSPFVQQCIGIETVQPYKVRLFQVRVDFWRVIKLVVGVALFLYAGHLSHNSIFYYITGVVFGICSSFMLVIWMSSKLVPRRAMMYGVLIGGWTIGLYIVQLLWDNLQLIVLTYRTYVLWYILITGLVSFFFCYRLGPPKNKRSKNIVKWLLQLMALVLIYFTSYFEEAMAAIIIITVLIHYIPNSFINKIRSLFSRRFPQKRRLLTNAEYYEEGVRETTKALNELRSYASSPECKQWTVMTKLRDPLRFAAFVEGSPHLRDEEILLYESPRTEEDDSDESQDENEMHVTELEPMHNNNSYEYRRTPYNVPISRQVLYRSVNVSPEEISDDEEDEPNIQMANRSNGRNISHTLDKNLSRSSIDRLAPTASGRYSVRQEMPQHVNNQRTQTRSARMLNTVKMNSQNNQRQGKENRTLGMSYDSDEAQNH